MRELLLTVLTETPKDENNLMKSLEITWKGMLAIFIAMGIIFLFVYIFNNLMNVKVEKYADLDNKDLFAKIGSTLGKLSLYTGIVVLGLVFGIPGIVFSLLGKKSSLYQKEAQKGLKNSIIGSCVGLAALVVVIVVLTLI